MGRRVAGRTDYTVAIRTLKGDQMKRIKLVQVGMVRDADDESKRSIVTNPAEAVGYLEEYRDSDREHFLALALDARNKVVHMEVVSIGTLNSAIVHPREVFKSVILANGASVILAHNHPSGDTTPSKEDIGLTQRLVNAGEILGIEVLDHLIVTHDSHLSMKEANLL